jgi:hypothetical protein
MFSLFLIIASLTGASAAFKSDQKSYVLNIGNTPITVTREVFPTPEGCADCLPGLSFLNLHENENTSVVAVRSFLLSNGGSLTKFAKGNTRTISFSMTVSQTGKTTTYTFDPNRMFTPEGIKATLDEYSTYSSSAAAEVEEFANNVLSLYEFSTQSIVLALHNNGGQYGAKSYLPGGSYANDAEKVHIENGTNPSDFFYVVDPYYYDSLALAGYNVVLQNNETVTNDGSLSYYSGLQGRPYINFESQAEFTSYGQQVVIQLDMVYAVKAAVKNALQAITTFKK